LNWFFRTKLKKPKKKEEEGGRVCEKCQKKKRHNGYNHKKVLSTQGQLRIMNYELRSFIIRNS